MKRYCSECNRDSILDINMRKILINNEIKNVCYFCYISLILEGKGYDLK